MRIDIRKSMLMEGVSFFAPNLGWLHSPRVVLGVVWHVAVTSRTVIIHEASLHGLSTSIIWIFYFTILYLIIRELIKIVVYL